MGGSVRPGGACACFPTYTGPRCTQMALLPAQTSLALFRANASSWGGAPVRDPADGSYHLYYADMEHGCGLKAWECNSAVGHATSPAGHPEGAKSLTRCLSDASVLALEVFDLPRGGIIVDHIVSSRRPLPLPTGGWQNLGPLPPPPLT